MADISVVKPGTRAEEKPELPTNYPPEILLEQYKLFVEMADRVSSRRVEASKFYVGLLSGILTLLSITGFATTFQPQLMIFVGILGLILCGVWLLNIESYRNLNKLKFDVIHEMETRLPFHCYDREWELLKQNPGKYKYLRLTRVEKYVPIIMAMPYLLLILYSVW